MHNKSSSTSNNMSNFDRYLQYESRGQFSTKPKVDLQSACKNELKARVKDNTEMMETCQKLCALLRTVDQENQRRKKEIENLTVEMESKVKSFEAEKIQLETQNSRF